MSLQNGLPARHLNAYHQNDSLLFQFILFEFLEAHYEAQMLLQKRHASSEISSSLVKLASSVKETTRLFSWNPHDGILTKLKNYCAIFSQNAILNEKEPLAMHHYAEKSWSYCWEATKLDRENSHERSVVFSVIDKSNNALNRFARLIARVLTQFRDDENVIYFVLRHHKQFDALYGSKFVSKLFCRLFPKGLREACHFLTQKYNHRGFNNLLPHVDANFIELETCSYEHN